MRTQQPHDIGFVGWLQTRNQQFCDAAYSWRQLLQSGCCMLSRQPSEDDTEDGGAVGLRYVVADTACVCGGQPLVGDLHTTTAAQAVCHCRWR